MINLRASLRLALLALGTALFALPGCAPSLVYDPTLHLPQHGLRMNDGQASASFGLLAETRPSAAGAHAVPGPGVGLRYAFSNSFALGARWWGTFTEHYSDASDTNVHFRSGAALDAILPLSMENGSYRSAIIPRVGIAMDGGSIGGFGVSASLAYWLPSNGALSTYAAIGPIIGVRNDEDAGSGDMWGYGLVGNLGTALRLSETFNAHVEVAGVVQRSLYDSITHGILVPSLGIDWYF